MWSLLLKVYIVLLVLLSLSACTSNGQQQTTDPAPTFSTLQGSYVCRDASRYDSQVIGTGHCVSLIRHCSSAPFTRYWQQGEHVKGRHITPGTVIANFRSGKYPNKTGWHAAIYISQDDKGIWVWDQWVGKPVHKRLIRFKNGKGTPNNDGDAYYVVR